MIAKINLFQSVYRGAKEELGSVPDWYLAWQKLDSGVAAIDWPDFVEKSFSSRSVDLSLIAAIPDFPEFKVEELKEGSSALIALLNRLEQKLDGSALLNQRCNVHIGGNPLFLVDEVIFETDLCTQELQKILEEGWRILAICVQPDQRRPDYILGRTK